jgi:hypothetical protein
MSKFTHRVFIGILVTIVLVTLIALILNGIFYYRLGLEDRVYHPDHGLLKPSGTLGHGLGIAGSFCMIIGVGSYMARKRYRFLSRIGILKHWLEMHIFLCTLGPILVLFHTAFKFGGLVAVSFWSMVAVFLSGIIGRFIYIQIPRTMEGRALSLQEVREVKTDIAGMLKNSFNLDEESFLMINDSIKNKIGTYHTSAWVRFIKKYHEDRRSIQTVKAVLKRNTLPKPQYRKILDLAKSEITLNRRIDRLDTMQNLFKYWHVAHLPFALVMLVIMIIHVGVTLVFGYHWIF